MSNVTEQTTMDSSAMTATELALTEMWRDLLGVPNISRTDNFFELGATSLSAIKLIQRVERKFGPDTLLPDTLYGDPRLSSVANAIDELVHK